MKKITEIKYTTRTTKEVKNELGQRERIKEPIQLNRKVKTIQGWQRFGHYLIDYVIIIGIVFGIQYAAIMGSMDIDFEFNFNVGGGYYGIDLTGYFVILFYYTLLETTIGRTIGKFATQSFVIDEYAEQPPFKTILLRSLTRLIPFFAFSCLGERGWHDRWTGTYVVSKSEMEFLRKSLSDDYYSDDMDILDA